MDPAPRVCRGGYSRWWRRQRRGVSTAGHPLWPVREGSRKCGEGSRKCGDGSRKCGEGSRKCGEGSRKCGESSRKCQRR